jgi:hypothetical protein
MELPLMTRAGVQRQAETTRAAVPSLTLDPHIVQCRTCGYRYVSGLPGEASLHRRYHTAWMKPRRPKPDRLIAALVPAGGDLIVDHRSPRWLHRRVYEIAHALKCDEGYDCTQWSADGALTRTQQCHAILFVEPGGIPIGACSFSWIVWQDAPASWRMNFVWIAEPYRRQGQLVRRWPLFQQRYGEFALELPLSKAMRAFITKHGCPNSWQITKAAE